MTFRYDQAEVAFRTMDAFRGSFPFTGIVNSLGFHNAGGYVWTVLPAFAVSPDPRWATAWHGLLSATIVFPLLMLGKRYRSDGLAYLPAVIAAVAPVSVFAGRNLWAQCLLPPLIAWALLALNSALAPKVELKNRIRNASLALGLLAWSVSVHYSAGLLFIVSVGLLLQRWPSDWKSLAKATIPAIIICITMVPSGLDWWESKQNPRPKPEFAAQFEAFMPPPLPWWARIQDSMKSVFLPQSEDAVPGIASVLKLADKMVISLVDTFLMVITCASLLFVTLGLFQRVKKNYNPEHRQLLVLVLTWLLLPIVVGSVMVPRVNAGYFFGLLPAMWLLPLFLPIAQRRWVTRLLPGGFLVLGTVASVLMVLTVSKSPYVPGNYYIAYGDQLATVRHAIDKNVKPGRMSHLGGPWFSHSYDYIHRLVAEKGKNTGDSYALIDDFGITSKARASAYLEKKPALFAQGKVGILVFPSRGQAEIFMQQYYDTPAR